jgi:glutamyl-tRNA synthetase
MEISHVIRGEEWLPSLPLHYLLYRALGWSDTQPLFAHLPLLLKPTGQGKLSKRDGDKLGFPVFPLQWTAPDGEVSRGYREDGYFPEAFINMLALLGWNPGTEQEIFTMQELIDSFSLERVGKSGARFSPEKALWFNAQYMHTRDDNELGAMFLPILREHGCDTDLQTATKVASFIKTRATFVSDFWDLSHFIFIAPESYEQKQVDKYWKGENPAYMRTLRELLAGQADFSADALREAVFGWIHGSELSMGQVMNTFRLLIIGVGKGPDMFDICEVLGRDETLRRMDRAMEVLG